MFANNKLKTGTKQELKTTIMTEEKVQTFFRFEDLRLYGKTMVYAEWVYKKTQMFPESEAKTLIETFQTAAQNVPVLIAEGSALTRAIFVEFLNDARSCVRQCVVLTTLSTNMGYLSPEEENDSREMLIEISKMLGALLTSLQKTNINIEKQPAVETDI
ncbi:MAG: four helix bundle protein [Oscillospiraceae bacterium]|jgi:four helix bundle protein